METQVQRGTVETEEKRFEGKQIDRQGEKGVCDFSIMCVGSMMSCLMIIYSRWRSILSGICPPS